MGISVEPLTELAPRPIQSIVGNVCQLLCLCHWPDPWQQYPTEKNILYTC